MGQSGISNWINPRPASTADPLSPDIDAGKRDDELNLLYVAVTRAMKILAVNSLVIDIMQRFKDMKHRSRP
ncbi:Uncharacterized protein ALO80_04307 [Pseudomonas caricapapayae]|uniref:Uncharacterized protein n=1 Tax=Pseudomonas caricapapayae TaxID=46678 RepID=A0A0P9KSJ3_9PSED|nr:hypothetical protein [Pseudomonas caricapapayae]KAA8690061.1 hypothetical protein F4W67_26845 [Pseudomonas caricapapayae]KPW59202.1 Uncharacterized protein ALO80_04307 [Pseudomonas caricapapayae]RMM11990.1 hypothetical protein ALQ84_00317 [Pseudomonas caricapapayae]RMV67007.1 hypothetical protein ALP05_03737 [Pseudomonas caricapapayae]RMV98466.1 hypothetical protein ALP01_200359 [Pseudomonas caricapapayae]